ncbi:DnaJ-domain-containing protein [Gyrodon lividus]|nr:DnaJ-domain-containing protein [Gyrodon lividus]
MFSYVLSSASSFWRSPSHDDTEYDERATLTIHPERIDRLPRLRSPEPVELPCLGCKIAQEKLQNIRSQEIREVLSSNDLYHILGVPHSPTMTIDRLTLRRAYLSRSKACHPDKFPGNPDATYAFQKVSMAYDILSEPSSKRIYDSRPSHNRSDFFASHSASHADETLRDVLTSIVSDFLDGNLEMIRTLLRAIHDLNPSLGLGDDGINSVLSVLQSIRGRVLTCRACMIALHTELSRVLELQYTFRQLPYLDITGRSRLTIQLTRITLSLPVTLEKAIQDFQGDFFSDGQIRTTDKRDGDSDKVALVPKCVVLLIRGIDVMLDKMERILG